MPTMAPGLQPSCTTHLVCSYTQDGSFHQTRLQTRHPGGEVFRLTIGGLSQEGDEVKQLQLR